MRIACPDCNATYDLPPERVRPGRGVKCARCATVWVPVALVDAGPGIPVTPEPAPPPPPEPEPEPAPPPPAPEPAPPPPPSRTPVALAWLLSALVLLALAWAAISNRESVTRAWPPAERAYNWLHL